MKDRCEVVLACIINPAGNPGRSRRTGCQNAWAAGGVRAGGGAGCVEGRKGRRQTILSNILNLYYRTHFKRLLLILYLFKELDECLF